MPADRTSPPPPDATRGPTTLSEVAAAAGVSISTVSRIVSGRARVSDEKRAVVEKAIEALNFTPNALAQGLKRGRSMTIGVVTPQMDGASFINTLKGIDDELRGSDYVSLIVASHFDLGEEMDRARLLLSRRVDGIVILSSIIGPSDVRTLAARVPVVTIGQNTRAPNTLGVLTDNELGGYLATRHLLELGHRRIVHVGGLGHRASAAARAAGYRRALDEAGVPFDPRLVVAGQYSELSGVAAVAHLFEVGVDFTAVFAANDQSAAGVALGLHRRGIRVPDDVSLVGFDDTGPARYAIPPLTTVRVPLYEMGRLAARGLLDLLENREANIDVPPPELIVRESTARCR